MQGKRIEPDPNKPDQFPFPVLKPGEYGKDVKGNWWGVAPGEVDEDGFSKLLINLKGHKVTEHEDGTISADPSILVSNHTGTWHGYIERGIWREC